MKGKNNGKKLEHKNERAKTAAERRSVKPMKRGWKNKIISRQGRTIKEYRRKLDWAENVAAEAITRNTMLNNEIGIHRVTFLIMVAITAMVVSL